MLAITLKKPTRPDKSIWHHRRLFLRVARIGGYGTEEPQRWVIILYARIWAKKDTALGRWIFAENNPVKIEES